MKNNEKIKQQIQRLIHLFMSTCIIQTSLYSNDMQISLAEMSLKTDEKNP